MRRAFVGVYKASHITQLLTPAAIGGDFVVVRSFIASRSESKRAYISREFSTMGKAGTTKKAAGKKSETSVPKAKVSPAKKKEAKGESLEATIERCGS